MTDAVTDNVHILCIHTKGCFAHLPASADVMAMSGGGCSARVVGREIDSVSLLFQSCCSACRKTNGGSCRFRLERLRIWKSSTPEAAPSSASASGYSGDPSHTWHNTNTNLPFTSALPFTELCGIDNAQAGQVV